MISIKKGVEEVKTEESCFRIIRANGFGKTVVCCNMIAQRKVNTLIILESSELIHKRSRFIIATTKDDQVSKASDMIERLNMSNTNYQQYKNRLRDAGVIDQERRGVIMITVPRMKEYLRRKYGEE